MQEPLELLCEVERKIMTQFLTPVLLSTSLLLFSLPYVLFHCHTLKKVTKPGNFFSFPSFVEF